ncbi:LamG-like jellyroll fold domain-containing protein [uncultured Polaribacter sp.]|uniref:LamG-like jellyroll fold domain-containing protein n=1 Tax=uncultured Polaribacter sp. TaxID=174711 RepID=UPI00261929C3|nr:LamG-like jellyroll fold domain-containing protein [uncultured Polaribacter sp.]
MRKILHVLCMCLVTFMVTAQENSKNHIFLGNAAVDNTQENAAIKVQMQIGGPVLSHLHDSEISTSFGFPYGVLYISSTFYDAGFEVSKGYYGDRIQLDWSIGANKDEIENYIIYRRPYASVVSTDYFQVGDDGALKVHESFGEPLVTLGSDVYTYVDTATEGVVLYEYLVYATGISAIADKYTNYITGIGYKNPTAVVTGNISFAGGTPVKDVIVRAEPDGDEVSVGSSIYVSDEGRLNVKYLSEEITTEGTFQSWLRIPESADFRWLKLQKRAEVTENTSSNFVYTDVKLVGTADEKAIEVTVGNNNNNSSVYKVMLKNYFPTGQVDGKGDDILKSISELHNDFIHLSVVLNENESPLVYLNGRLLNDAFIETITAVQEEIFDEEARQIPELTTTGDYVYQFIEDYNSLEVADELDGIVDEVRLWKEALSERSIRQDFKRYLSGTEANLLMYLRADEGNGAYAYDLSAKGYDFNKNEALLYKSEWTTNSEDKPDSNQLGVLGVTDDNGNYIIAAIPYSGAGESFNITPSFGVHQFSPSQQLIFLGAGAEVVNKIDFEDVSSFIFRGKARMDLVGTFDPITNNDGTVNLPDILQVEESGYNEYTVTDVNGTIRSYQKGDYQAGEEANTIVDMPNVGVAGANVYIDGNIVLDEESKPLTTDEDGGFVIEVPIGNHYIEIKKDNHEFTYGGRFPMLTADALAQQERVKGSSLTEEEKTYIEENHKTEFDFFEHQETSVTFLDQTKVTLVGKVVGGSVEAAKPIGFGYDGYVEHVFNEGEDDETKEAVSAINNIGQATIKLSHEAGDIIITTNAESGEYRRELAPLLYTIEKTSTSDGVTIINDTEGISGDFLNANETLNLSDVPATSTSEFSLGEGVDPLVSEPYHYEKSFVYRSAPQLFVTRQTSEETLSANGEVYSTEGLTLNGSPLAFYKQGGIYYIDFETYEEYHNYDGESVEEFKVPVIDGGFIINNNLEMAAGTLVYDEDDKSKSTYTFMGGIPTISAPFKKTISINYRVNGLDTPAVGYNPEGLLLGGAPDGTQTFVTAAPEVPAIVLRDPPGTNSFASIEKGTSISITSEAAYAHSGGYSDALSLSLGADSKIVTSPAGGPIIETSLTNDFEAGVSVSRTSSNGTSLTKTYTFNQTISTSAEQDYVGAEGDLYIGESKNYYYGSYDNIILDAQNYDGNNSVSLEFTNSLGEKVPLYISKTKEISFSEANTATMFIYSQKYLIETLIPELELIVSNLQNGLLDPNAEGVEQEWYYQQQIDLWKESIASNEYAKYRAFNETNELKEEIKDNLQEDIDDLKRQIDEKSFSGVSDSKMNDKLNELYNLQDQLEDRFQQNISFDAGVGEFSSSFETYQLKTQTKEYSFSMDESFSWVKGFKIGGNGFENSISVQFTQTGDTSISKDDEETTTIGYTLVDNDEANVLSVDVVNVFDDNGPIFITQGGRTSCPYEDETKAEFLNKDSKEYFKSVDDYYSYLEKKAEYENALEDYNINKAKFDDCVAKNGYFACQTEEDAVGNEPVEPDVVDKPDFPIESIGTIDNTDTDKENHGYSLNYATQKVEDPVISALETNITGVPEDGKAEFTLILENNGVGTSDHTDFNLKIDTPSNPHNVIFNIREHDNTVNVPRGEKVYFTLTMEKSVEDVFEYKDIKLIFESMCDDVHTGTSILLSASFIPSCSNVSVSAPFDGWVVNHSDIYNDDGSTNSLKVELSEFNPDYNSFKKIDLQYRKSTSSSWTRLHTYYKAPFTTDEGIAVDYLATAIENGEDKNSSITDTTIDYDFDIAGLGLDDAEYEIRAISYCTDDTEYVSDVVSGTVDLTRPQQFGTPSPTDGILGSGDDLRLQFSEPIVYNSAISKIEIVAETNQLPVNHAVSVAFEGADNTMVIEKTNVFTGDYSIEFWMDNQTTGNATIMQQENGFSIALVNGEMVWTLGGQTVQGTVSDDDLFHHYTLTYHQEKGELRIYEDSTELKVATVGDIEFTNSGALTIGGNSFVGNIHDLRMWTKSISLAESVASFYEQFTGSERDLVGYWKMNEGRGAIANDLARFIHGVVNAEWNINPKTTGYDFADNQYLTLNLNDLSQFGAATQIDDEMDVTLSFWVKTASTNGTIISNGRGTEEDLLQSNGKRNKWSVEVDGNGNLVFNNEGFSYELTENSIADDSWHHVAIVVRRSGSLNTYLDNGLVTSHNVSNIGGISGSKFWIGARGYTNEIGVETIDRNFTGKLEEIRLWNTARSLVQIERDSYTEIASNTLGLIMYASMNNPEIPNGKGPAYFHQLSTGITASVNAELSSGTPNYTEDTPKLQPARELLSFDVSYVINGDEIIITPQVSDWSVLENQILDITVDRLFDAAENQQASPVTWTAFVSKNNVEWYVNENESVVEIEKTSGESYEFEITLLNKGGVDEKFEITNIPNWLTLSETSGSLDPSSGITIQASIASELSIGEYVQDLFLETDFGLDEKLQLDLRVLSEAPDWSVNEPDYSNNMNIIGVIKINDQFSRDEFTKVGAFVNEEPRGEAYLLYDDARDSYFVFLTAYSNVSSGEDVTFKIWDGLNGKVLTASIDGLVSVPFLQNEVLGTKSSPVVFSGDLFSEQTISLNEGWTWFSSYVEDARFDNIKETFDGLTLAEGDQIKSQNLFSKYESGDWFGSLSNIEISTMYKVKLATANSLTLVGQDVDETNLNLALNEGWNWLPFPIHKSTRLQDALSLYEPTDGDVIKDQFSFAIYDELSGWSGSLTYLTPNSGYMMRSGVAQTFNYPSAGTVSKFVSGNKGVSSKTVALFSKYSSNMNVVAEVLLDDAYTDVLVYDEENNLRGTSPIVEVDGKKISFVTVFSDGNDTMKFIVSDGTKLIDVSSNFIFESNKVYGSLKKPVALGVKEVLASDSVELSLSEVLLYPNPFSDSFIIDGSLQTDKVVKVEILSMLGNKVYSKSTPEDKTIVDTSVLARGVYFVILTSHSGKSIAKKMIKK